MSGGRAELERELGGVSVALAARLSPEQLEALTAAVADAKARQAKELSDAADTALKNIPRIFRGAAKKVLLG